METKLEYHTKAPDMTGGSVQIERVVIQQYSDQAPIEKGWYWMKSEWLGDTIIKVYTRPGHKYLCILDPSCCEHTKRHFLNVNSFRAKWAGPIKEPV